MTAVFDPATAAYIEAKQSAEFAALIEDHAADFTLPPAYALGECTDCGETTNVTVSDDGDLRCQDCQDARPVYDPSDEHGYLRDDWENDR